MASNKELVDEALALGKELNVEVTTQGLNNGALVELVESLKAKRPPAEPPAALPDTSQAPPVPPEPPAAPEPPTAVKAPIDGTTGPAIGGRPSPGTPIFQRYNHQVAEGKMVTTRRGMIGAFEPVTAEDFGQGEAGKKALQGLVASGHVSQKS